METTALEDSGREPAPGRLRLVQELLNTNDTEAGVDELAGLDGLASWLRAHELIAAREHLADADLSRAIAFREGLRALLEERAHGGAAEDTVRTLTAVSGDALLRARFDAGGVPRLVPAAAGLDGAIAALLAIIGESALDGTWARLKVCAEDGCRWAFYDRSKNRSGSWCSMAVCGNRAKARSFRERRRAGGGVS